MKSYIVTTGAIFGLITLAHLLRIIAEPHLATDLAFNLLTVLSAALTVWAACLLGPSTRRGDR